MGVNITEIVSAKEISLDSLSGKVIAVDAHLFLYQFITTIRQRDGSPLTDSKGRVTSHLSGIFSRNANLMQKGIRLAYIFDGKPPELKLKERERRKSLKASAAIKYDEAKAQENIDEMRKYAARTARLTSEMVSESKRLIAAMGIPIVDAPSEGEAQASHMVKQEKAFAVASQDADSLLFGSTRLLRNLSLAGKRKKANKLAFEAINPEIVSLSDTLNNLGIDQDQLIALGILVGTDFNMGGIKGIGPHKALKLVKEHDRNFDKLFEAAGWKEYFDYPWQDVFRLFKNIPVTDDYSLSWEEVDRKEVYKILVEEHDFSPERVDITLDRISLGQSSQAQRGLRDFF